MSIVNEFKKNDIITPLLPHIGKDTKCIYSYVVYEVLCQIVKFMVPGPGVIILRQGHYKYGVTLTCITFCKC